MSRANARRTTTDHITDNIISGSILVLTLSHLHPRRLYCIVSLRRPHHSELNAQLSIAINVTCTDRADVSMSILLYPQNKNVEAVCNSVRSVDLYSYYHCENNTTHVAAVGSTAAISQTVNRARS